MLTSIRGICAASFSTILLASAAPVLAADNVSQDQNAQEQSGSETGVETGTVSAALVAPDVLLEATPKVERAGEPVDLANANSLTEGSGLSVSGNVAFVTEYRFRGVDLSGGDFAVQGGFDVAHSSGLYVGAWGSNIDDDTVGFGSSELDIYGGWSGEVANGLTADIGVIGYLYPDAGPGDFDYIEFYGSLSASLGPASITGGAAYAPDQSSLGGTDNLYIYGDASVGIPTTPITLNAHLGYTDGFLTFTNDSKAVDWSISADVAAGPVTLSAAYVGVEGDALVDPGKVFTDDAFVLSVSASF